jgi:hypothetical protein
MELDFTVPARFLLHPRSANDPRPAAASATGFFAYSAEPPRLAHLTTTALIGGDAAKRAGRHGHHLIQSPSPGTGF